MNFNIDLDPKHCTQIINNCYCPYVDSQPGCKSSMCKLFKTIINHDNYKGVPIRLTKCIEIESKQVKVNIN